MIRVMPLPKIFQRQQEESQTVDESSQSDSPEGASAQRRSSAPSFDIQKILSKVFPILLVVLLLAGAGGGFWWWYSNRSKGGPAGSTTELVYWGLWEPDSVMSGLIEKYEKDHPEVTIDYRQQSITDYRRRLQSALAAGEGPDIFRYHNTWLPMLSSNVSSVPRAQVEQIQLESDFYSNVKESLFWQGDYYGIPLYFDTLALYYNKEIFSDEGVQPPTTWDELRRIAARLTIKQESGQIIRSGVALGQISNVDHWSDIVGLMILQNGGNLAGNYDQALEQAIEFFLVFSKQDGVWDETLPNSTRAFAGGQVAMYFGPSWRMINLQELNPELDFGVVPMPQLAGGQEINWASYWVEGVSTRSENKEAAWDFLAFLSREENLQQLYKAGSQVHYIGEIYPRKSMAGLLEDDPLVSPFVEQAPTATSWYLCSATGDSGINDNIIQYFTDAVNQEKNRGTMDLPTLEQGVTSVLGRYQAITL